MIQLSPWLVCECGKIHTRRYITETTVCTCGRNLWSQAWS